MFVPMPILIATGLLIVALLALLARRPGETRRDLIAPPPRPAARPVLSSLDDPAFDAEIRELVDGGKKLEAIKRVRERTGLGLKEAKDWVEAI